MRNFVIADGGFHFYAINQWAEPGAQDYSYGRFEIGLFLNVAGGFVEMLVKLYDSIQVAVPFLSFIKVYPFRRGGLRVTLL